MLRIIMVMMLIYGNDAIKEHLDELYKKEKEEKNSNLEEELKLEKEKVSNLKKN